MPDFFYEINRLTDQNICTGSLELAEYQTGRKLTNLNAKNMLE